jgi:hypothetical protein
MQLCVSQVSLSPAAQKRSSGGINVLRTRTVRYEGGQARAAIEPYRYLTLTGDTQHAYVCCVMCEDRKGSTVKSIDIVCMQAATLIYVTRF